MMQFLTKIYVSSLFVSFAMMLAACSLAEPEVKPFNPQEISCSDRSSPDWHKKIEEIRKNPEGDLYFISHADEILVDMKKLAEQGNYEGMIVFGDLQREKLLVELIHGKNGSFAIRPFPNEYHTDIVTALTYVYMVASQKNYYQKDALQLIYAVEGDRSNIKTPPAWIEEAKDNAQEWKDYCSRE